MPFRLRRLFQFRLGTLLLVVTLFGVWLGVEVNHANRQRRAVAAIRAAGGLVNYDFQRDKNSNPIPDAEPPTPKWLRKLIGDDYFSKVTIVDFATEYYGRRRELGLSKVDDEGLRCFESLPDVTILELGNNRAITDTGLIHLRRLYGLRTLYLYRSSVTGPGLVHLASLPNLRALQLNWTPLTNEGLIHIGRMTNLEALVLADTPVTDDSLAALRNLTRLKDLRLHNTKITDRGLVHLESLTALEHLTLPSAVTDDRLNQLKQALPNCQMGRAQ